MTVKIKVESSDSNQPYLIEIGETQECFKKVTVNELKTKLWKIESLRTLLNETQLQFSGVVLENNGKSLSSYGIKENSLLSFQKLYDKDKHFGIKFVQKDDAITGDNDPTILRAELSCGHAVDPNSLTGWCRSLIDAGKYEFYCPAITDGKVKKCEKKLPYVEIRSLALLNEAEMTSFEKKRSASLMPQCKTIKQRSVSTDKKVLTRASTLPSLPTIKYNFKDCSFVNSVKGLNGLINIGNSCYMNSGLQCLNNVKAFRDFFLQTIKLNNSFYKINGELADAYREIIIRKIWSKEAKKIQPSKFKEKFSSFATFFNDYQQKDSFEFINSLLDILHCELKNEKDDTFDSDVFKEKTANSVEAYKEFKDSGYSIMVYYSQLSIISNLFYMLTYQRVVCLECGNISVKYDPPISSIVLPLPNNTDDFSSFYFYETKINIVDCFESITKKKTNQKPSYFCKKCKNKTGHESEFLFWNLPKVLILQLSRFTCDLYGGMKKNNQIIEFPLKLNLQKFSEKQNGLNYEYELTSISNHYGSFNGGHYDCFAKNSEDNFWYCFNDSSVSKLTEKDLCTKNAHVLIYSLKN